MYVLPVQTPIVIEKLLVRDWIVHSFNLEDKESFYSPSEFLYNSDVKDIEYVLYLDTNIYQFLLSSYRKISNEITRDAISLLVFCQLSKIEIDPVYAIYEKINYTNEKVDETIEELKLFYQINNSNIYSLISYSLGELDSYKLGPAQKFDVKHMKENLTKYERLTEWDSLYLIMLACVSISKENISRQSKLLKFRVWMLKDFRQSLVGFVYGVVFFSEKPLKRMMKYKSTNPSEVKRSQLFNMTWDLYIMNSFFRKWLSVSENVEFIYATDDKAFRTLLRIAIDMQINEGIEPLKKILSKRDYINTEEIWNLEVKEDERVYKSNTWTPSYRDQLIEEFEKELL